MPKKKKKKSTIKFFLNVNDKKKLMPIHFKPLQIYTALQKNSNKWLRKNFNNGFL